VKALNPVSGWKGSLEQQGAYDIDGGTNHALGLAVLRESVGTRHLKLDAVRERKCGLNHYRTGRSGWCNQTERKKGEEMGEGGKVSDFWRSRKVHE
jgi:hypothetical protein